MENLVEIKNNQVITSSRKIAEHFGKRHDHVKRDIEELINKMSIPNFGETPKMFYKATYIHEQNKQSYVEYFMNRDGFSLLVMGFTGKEALEWKIKYIQAFNQMEEALKQIPKVDQNAIKCKREEIQLEKSKLWLQLADRVDLKEYKQICESYAANTLAGEKVLPLPEMNEKTYSATEIGKILGISANKVGSLAKQNNLKTEKYGKWFYDKSRYSNKQVETFRYYHSVIGVFKELITA